MKTYYISRSEHGIVGCSVSENRTVNAAKDMSSAALDAGATAEMKHHAYILPHCVFHSPTGFEYGYGGSGPADLALSILADYLGADKETVERCATGAFSLEPKPEEASALRALRLHQYFKSDFIDGEELKRGRSVTIRGEDIQDWLDDDAAFEVTL